MEGTIRLARASVACIALLAAAMHAAAAQSSPTRDATPHSTLSGVYTAGQAARGETVFRNVCGNCHTTGEFSGAGFQAKWAGGSVFTFVEQVRSNMPLDNPGGLSAAEYAAVVAYILKLNTFPAGATELPTQDSALRQIRFERVPPKPQS
jgi:mono/diheme cytochrome c family protein